MTIRKNPYREGDVVTVIHHNGSGEGILWRVTKVGAAKMKLVVCFTATGPSVLNDKTVDWHEAKLVDLVTLCSVRAQLDNLINDVVRTMSQPATAS